MSIEDHITREEFSERVWAWVGSQFSHDKHGNSLQVAKAMMAVYDDDPDYALTLTLIKIYDRCGVAYARP